MTGFMVYDQRCSFFRRIGRRRLRRNPRLQNGRGAIARNTRIKPGNIEKVKKHLFYDEHLLDRYTELGVPAEWRRFDSDLAIANAWKRLENGNYTELDMRLLRHEAAEMNRMRKLAQRFSQGHDAAERRYPAPAFQE